MVHVELLSVLHSLPVKPYNVMAYVGLPIAKEMATKIYYGIFIDDKYISYCSTRREAEDTMRWLEEWLRK